MRSRATPAKSMRTAYSGGPNEHGAEVFVDAGGNLSQVRINLAADASADHHLARHWSAFRGGRPARRYRQGRSRRAPGIRSGGLARAAGRAPGRLPAPLRRIVRARRLRRRRALQSRDAGLFDLRRDSVRSGAISCPDGCPNAILLWICATGRTSPAITCCRAIRKARGRTASTRSKARCCTCHGIFECRPRDAQRGALIHRLDFSPTDRLRAADPGESPRGISPSPRFGA